MPTVPVYQRTERLRPELQQGVTTQASGNDFGAQIGAGLQQVSRGLDNAGEAVAQVNALKDESMVRQRRNAMMEEKRLLMYDPETGYMTKSGQAAIDARPKFEQDLRALNAKHAEGLSPAQQNLYERTTEPLVQDGLQSGIVHNANELKTQIANDAAASSENFLNEALVNYANPAKADKYVAAGLLEIKNLGEKQGWTADILESKQRTYLSGATQKMALRIAAENPLAAKEYITKNSSRLSADDQFELDLKLKPIVQEAEATANAADLLGKKRGSGVDVVKEVVDAASNDNAGREDPGAATGADRPVSTTGPTKVRAFLAARAPGKGMAAIDGLDDTFATNLAAMIEDAPPSIRAGLQVVSGVRSNERQEELFANSDRTGHSVAFPAGYRKPDGSIAKGSNHLRGKAVDLGWNGKLLRPGNAPQEVIDWVHSNVGSYGMYFRMGHEPWHVEPTGGRGSTVASKVDMPVSRSAAPSYDEIQTYLGNIKDPVVREKTQEKIFQSLAQQDKIREMNQQGARQQLWDMWEKNGQTPDQAPVDLRIAAGNTAVDSINESIKKEREGYAVTDQNVLFGLNRMAAENPQGFKSLDLTDYYAQLSREDRKAVADSQNKLLSGDVEAQQSGANYNAAYKQAEQSLASVGLTTTGIPANSTTKRAEMETRVAKFQNALKSEIDQFRTQNGKTPGYDETQSLINALLMKSIYTEERSAYSPARLFDDGQDQVGEGLMFERGDRPDGSNVKPVVEYPKIPPEWQSSIRTALTERNGKPPSRQEIEAEYAAVVMEILGQN